MRENTSDGPDGTPPAADTPPPDTRHPGRALFDEAMCCYNALRSRVTNKRKALRLLRAAKALDFPAAHSSLANHFLEQSHSTENPLQARRYFETALKLLEDGGAHGHGRCWATAAEVQLSRKWWRPDPEPASAIAYWRKYFQSQTFLRDDDTRWTRDCCGVISFSHRFLGDQGFPRAYYIGVFLDSLVRFDLPIDPEITAVLKPFKDEVRSAVQERLARFEKHSRSPSKISERSRRLLSFFDHLT